MPEYRNPITRRRVQLAFALVLASILYAQFLMQEDYEPVLNRPAVVLAAEPINADSFERLVRENPLDSLKAARERHLRTIRDYECVLVKQEKLANGEMTQEQEIQVRHRLDPYSVVLTWMRNPGLANRVIYVKDKWIDPDAAAGERQQAACQPVAKALQLVTPPGGFKQPIHGFMAKRSARRAVDEFGFLRALDLLIKYCDIAAERNELHLAFRGESRFDGRPVWVIRRTLPYEGEGGRYPDRTAVIYLDKKDQVPVAVYCFSDDDESPEHLLGKYEYRSIKWNVDLSDSAFDPATYGM